MSNSEDFEKWVDENGSRCDDRDDAYRIWTAATEAADAKYQARVKELEEALMEVTLLSARNHAAWINAEQLLVNTPPDQALQRRVLEARIDEACKPTGNGVRIGELRKHLKEIGG